MVGVAMEEMAGSAVRKPFILNIVDNRTVNLAIFVLEFAPCKFILEYRGSNNDPCPARFDALRQQTVKYILSMVVRVLTLRALTSSSFQLPC
jgi:hypothetical protein